MNAVTHIVDGGEPPSHDGRHRRNTLLGFAIHTAASIWWAVFYEALFGAQARRSLPRALAAGAAVSAVAYVVDYRVVGPRLRPGFEAYLSGRSLFAMYAALAAGFAGASHFHARRRPVVGERQHQRERAALARRALHVKLTAEQARQLAADR